MTDREVMEYDIVVVGAGPAGLACAIRLKQLKPDINICVLEKASAVGAHSLSGAVLEPAALEKLLPNWRSEYTGMKVPAAEDDVRLMTKTGSFKLPNFAVSLSPMHNHGNFIVSLGQLTPWLAQQAEKVGIDIFPGFSAAGTFMPVYSLRQFGSSFSSAAGSSTAPESECAPTAAAFSSTQMFVSGLSCFRRIAQARPAGPAPMTTMSYSITSRSVMRALSLRCHADRAVEADAFAVEHRVLADVRDQRRVFFRPAEA